MPLLMRLPHMRGGVSHPVLLDVKKVASSPHAWGCFSAISINELSGGVFPTCVGVFLTQMFSIKAKPSLPHMRGGVSEDVHPDDSKKMSSPHAWRCFRLSSVDK